MTTEASGVSRIMQLLRIARLARVVRVLRLSFQLRLMIFMIFQSLKSLVWTMILLGIWIYTFSIVFTMAATDYIVPNALGVHSWELQGKLRETNRKSSVKFVARFLSLPIKHTYHCSELLEIMSSELCFPQFQPNDFRYDCTRVFPI